MNKKIRGLLEDELTIRVCQAFIVICFIFMAIFVWKWKVFPPELPLFYSMPRGVEQLASPIEFLLLPAFSIFIFLVHFIIAVIISSTEKVAAKILLITAFVVAFTMLLTFIRIVLLIT